MCKLQLTACIVVTCRDLFPTIVKCYATVCEQILSGASLQPTNSSSSSSKTQGQHTAKSHSIHSCNGSSSSSKSDVHIDDEIFAATVQLMAEGFLQMPQQQITFDVHQIAADAAALVAIVNTFVSQPWKKWLYLLIPSLCRVSRTTGRLMFTLQAFCSLMWVLSCLSSA